MARLLHRNICYQHHFRRTWALNTRSTYWGSIKYYLECVTKGNHLAPVLTCIGAHREANTLPIITWTQVKFNMSARILDTAENDAFGWPISIVARALFIWCFWGENGWSLRWRNNGRDSVSNHQPHHGLPNCVFRCRSKKTSNIRVTGLCAGNSPLIGEFPAQKASNAENVSIWWRHHVYTLFYTKPQWSESMFVSGGSTLSLR